MLSEVDLRYFKKEEDVEAGKSARGTFELTDLEIIQQVVPVAPEPEPAEADFGFMSLRGIKKGGSVVMSEASVVRKPANSNNRDAEEWQRTPRQLLDAHCRLARKRKLVFRHKGLLSKEERKNQVEFQCEVIIRDGMKREGKDIAFMGRPQGSRVHAEHDACLVPLRLYDRRKPYDRKLVEPWKTRWLELLDEPEPVPTMTTWEEQRRPAAKPKPKLNGRDRSVTAQSVREPTTRAVLQHDDPNHLGLWWNALPEHRNGPNHLGFVCPAGVPARGRQRGRPEAHRRRAAAVLHG